MFDFIPQEYEKLVNIIFLVESHILLRSIKCRDNNIRVRNISINEIKDNVIVIINAGVVESTAGSPILGQSFDPRVKFS